MLSKSLEKSTAYMIFFYKFWKKARVYYTLSISRGGGAGPRPPPPWIRHWYHTTYMPRSVTNVACSGGGRGWHMYVGSYICKLTIRHISDPNMIPDHTTCFAISLTWCTPDNLLRSADDSSRTHCPWSSHHVPLFRGSHVATYMYDPYLPPIALNTPYNARVNRTTSKFR